MGQRQKIKKIGFDTNFFIHHFEDNLEATIYIVEWIQKNNVDIHLSDIAFTEFLTNPIKYNNHYLIGLYKSIKHQKNIITHAIDFDILVHAAELRATYNLNTPDSIHLSTANIHGYDVFITEDKHLLKIKRHQKLEILSIKSFSKKYL